MPQAKLSVSFRLLKSDGTVETYSGNHHFETTEDEEKTLITRLTTVSRRELLNRGLIEPDEDEIKRAGKARRK